MLDFTVSVTLASLYSQLFFLFFIILCCNSVFVWLHSADLSFSCELALGRVGCGQMFLVPESCGITVVGEARKDLLRNCIETGC